ncbi:MAG: hypothetical protein WC273_10820 [Dehalococcoidia bacterium]
MAFLQMGLIIAAVAGAFVAGGALDAGFPVEVAIVRGAVAFMAVAFAGYLGELVIVTAPRRERARPRAVPPVEATNDPQASPSLPRLTPPQRTADVNEDDAGQRQAA